MQRNSWGKLASQSVKPLVSSPDDPEADTTLAFLSIMIASHADQKFNPEKPAGLYGVEWRSGAHSMVRQVTAATAFGEGPQKDMILIGFNFPWAHITGNGGGRWYNFHVMERVNEFLPEYRHLLVEGTSAPLSIYHLHAQHIPREFACELHNAKNVSIYGCKQEIEMAPFMKISHCQNIRVFGLAGWAMPPPGASNFLIEDSNDFLISNYAPFQEYKNRTKFNIIADGTHSTSRTNIKDYFPIIERLTDGTEVKVSPFDVPLLYLRGNPQ
jgi:hypothetical protein